MSSPIAAEPEMARFGYGEAARDAFAMAGIGPKDVDIAEIYDAYPVSNLIALEEIGLVERGSAGSFVAAGGTWPGGKPSRRPLCSNAASEWIVRQAF